MNKYLIRLVATLAILAPSAAAYAAQDAAPLPTPASEEQPVAAIEDSPSVPEADPAPKPEAEPAPSDTPTGLEPASDPAKDPVGTLGEIKTAVQSGNWGLAVLLILMLLVSALRWGAGKFEFLSFFKGKLGGYLLVFTASTGGMLLTVVGAGGALSFSAISQAVVFGFGAIGGWEAWKDVKSKSKAEVKA